MARHHVFSTVLLVASVVTLAACATPPDRTPLLERKFQQAARQFDQVPHGGQTLYCKKGVTRSLPYSECFTEAQLRRQVENHERRRNTVPPPLVAGTGQGGIG